MRKMLILLAAVSFLGETANADGLLFQLPEDGSWVRFKMKYEQDKTQRGKGVKRAEGAIKISSVGVLTTGGEACRWIEIETTQRRLEDPPKNERGRVFKLLIPEKFLQQGK
jgi:hypothetical protein